MPIVSLEPMHLEQEVPAETLLFDAACRAKLPVASSCSAEAVCGKCVMNILEGQKNLSPITPHEKRLLLRDKRKESERISCMTKVLGNCSVTTGYW
jgi:ferredoxin